MEIHIHTFLTSAFEPVVSLPPRSLYQQKNSVRYQQQRIFLKRHDKNSTCHSCCSHCRCTHIQLDSHDKYCLHLSLRISKVSTQQLICQLLPLPTHTKLQVLVCDKTFRGNLHLNYWLDTCGLVEQITGASWMTLNYTDQHHHQPSSKRAQLHNTPVWFIFTDTTFHSMALGLTTF